MNAQSLHSLIIDRHFGELSPEATELLAAHLAQNPEAQAEADRILRALATTEQAVLEHPELAPVGALENRRPADQPGRKSISRFLPTPWLARAAAIAALLVVSAVAGYYAGRLQPGEPGNSAPTVTVATVTPSGARPERPWASYRLAHDPEGGLRVERVQTLAVKRPTSSLR